MSRRSKVETGVGGNEYSQEGELTPLLGEGSDDMAGSSPRGRTKATLPSELRSSGESSAPKPQGRADRLVVWAGRQLGRVIRMDELDIYSLPSLAILMSYFSVGVALELLATPVAYYLIDDLGADSGAYTVWYILVNLPWSFKVRTISTTCSKSSRGDLGSGFH